MHARKLSSHKRFGHMTALSINQILVGLKEGAPLNALRQVTSVFRLESLVQDNGRVPEHRQNAHQY